MSMHKSCFVANCESSCAPEASGHVPRGWSKRRHPTRKGSRAAAVAQRVYVRLKRADSGHAWVLRALIGTNTKHQGTHVVGGYQAWLLQALSSFLSEPSRRWTLPPPFRRTSRSPEAARPSKPRFRPGSSMRSRAASCLGEFPPPPTRDTFISAHSPPPRIRLHSS